VLAYYNWDLWHAVGSLDKSERQYVGVFKDVPAFDAHDLGLHLRVANYAPLSRAWLVATSYRVLTRVDTRRMYDMGVIDRGEVKATYLDRGYDPVNAERMTLWTERMSERAAAGPERNRLIKAVQDSFGEGLIDRPTAEKGLTDILGSNRGVKIRLDAAVAIRKLAVARAVVKGVKRAYMRGHVDKQESQNRLQRAGVSLAAATQRVVEWDMELDPVRRELSTAQVLRLVKRGITSWGIGLRRLMNLGWTAQAGTELIVVVCGAKGAACVPVAKPLPAITPAPQSTPVPATPAPTAVQPSGPVTFVGPYCVH